MMHRIEVAGAMVGAMLMTALCARTTPESAAPRSLPRNLSEWTIVYGVSGGLAGIDRRLTVSSDGIVIVTDRNAAAHVERRAPAGLVARIAAFLQNADDEKASTSKPMPDAISRWLTAKTGGRDYPLQLTDDITAVLEGAMNADAR